MSILVLLLALGDAISSRVKEKAENRRALAQQRRYEDIDFKNIQYVTFDGTVTAYRIETEEEFDPVASQYFTELDGWQHYETKTVEYEVEDGENYCFTIRYKDGTEIYREFHESSSLTARLLEYSNKFANEVSEAVDALDNVAIEIGNLFTSQIGDNDYEN